MTDHAYTHELLREGQWTTDGRMLVADSVDWWESIPITYEDAILGALGNIRRENGRIYGDTDLEIPEDTVLTCAVDNIDIDTDIESGGLLIRSARLIGAHVSVKGSYPWRDEEEGGEADASRRDQQVADSDDPRRVEDG